MTEVLTESFCERCGTRYTFESARPRVRLKGVKVLSRGLKNFVLSDGTSMDEAMATARNETDREVTNHQLDAFHKTFSFCMSCRQYTCPNCWNEIEARCLTCAPDLRQEVLLAPFPDLATNGHLVAEAESGLAANGTHGSNGAHEVIGLDAFLATSPPTDDPINEIDVAARLEALTAGAVTQAPLLDIQPEVIEAPEGEIAVAAELPDAEVAAIIDAPAETVVEFVAAEIVVADVEPPEIVEAPEAEVAAEVDEPAETAIEAVAADAEVAALVDEPVETVIEPVAAEAEVAAVNETPAETVIEQVAAEPPVVDVEALEIVDVPQAEVGAVAEAPSGLTAFEDVETVVEPAILEGAVIDDEPIARDPAPDDSPAEPAASLDLDAAPMAAIVVEAAFDTDHEIEEVAEAGIAAEAEDVPEAGIAAEAEPSVDADVAGAHPEADADVGRTDAGFDADLAGTQTEVDADLNDADAEVDRHIAARLAAFGTAAIVADTRAPDEPSSFRNLSEKTAAQTGGLLRRFRPGQNLDAELDAYEREHAAELVDAPASSATPEIVAEAQPVAAIEGEAALIEPEVLATAAVAAAIASEPVVIAEPEVVEPVTAIELVVIAEPEVAIEPAVAAEAGPAVGPQPAPQADDLIAQPTWRMVAPDPSPVPRTEEAAPTLPAAATIADSSAEPQWPARPDWLGAAPSNGLPFLGRAPTPEGGLEALWAESNREVAATPGKSVAGGVQPCVSCGLSLSATARFCRRCGTPQAT